MACREGLKGGGPGLLSDQYMKVGFSIERQLVVGVSNQGVSQELALGMYKSLNIAMTRECNPDVGV